MRRVGWIGIAGWSLLAMALSAGIARAGDTTRAADVARVLAGKARALVGEDQGVYVETGDGQILVSQAARKPVHPASVSKVPTTLALLRQLGPDHRFTTRFEAAGPVTDGVLQGDLVVEADGDPFFVDENALLVALALRERGLRRVAGHLVIHGPLLFDWQADRVAARLEGALGGQVSEEAWAAVRAARSLPDARAPSLAFERRDAPARDGARQVLVVHRSEPLLAVVKALNGYSNNVFHPFAQRVGGVETVERIARQSVPPEMRDEIVLTNGAGAGATNRLSPRAAVALLRALADELSRTGHALPDALPVSGVDSGTLRNRLDAPGEEGVVVGKTGTYGDYGASALVGAVRSRALGVVYFAVLNHGVPVPAARERQNAFVSALLEALPADPWPYLRDDAAAFTRAEVRTP